MRPGNQPEKRLDVVAAMTPAVGHGRTGASYEFLDSVKLTSEAAFLPQPSEQPNMLAALPPDHVPAAVVQVNRGGG